MEISEDTKIRIYEATAVSVMLYISGTWATPADMLEKLDACHRKLLRTMLKLKWSDKIRK